MDEPRPGACLCWCLNMHPGDPGICEHRAATTRRFGPVDVPLCIPCAAAQGMDDLARTFPA